jgi:hypothetical protein
MTTTDPIRPVQAPTRPVQAQPRAYDRPDARETKPSLMTTEFWAMLVGVIAIVVVYNGSADSSFNLFRASTLATVLAVGYFVSRGLAKSGSTDITHDDHR